MIGKLLRGLSALLVYICVGTIIAQLIGLGVLWSRGALAPDRIMQVLAVVQGVDLATMRQEAVEAQITDNPAQPSFEDVVERRALALRDIEMRQIAVETEMANLTRLERRIGAAGDQLAMAEQDFQQRLDDLYDEALARGAEEARLILENIKPKQAKEQLIQMYEENEIDEVVRLFSAMPIAKRGKIAREFKQPDEITTLADILERMREGAPDADLVDETQVPGGTEANTP